MHCCAAPDMRNSRGFAEMSATRRHNAATVQPHTCRAVSTTSSSLRFWSSGVIRLPTTSEAKPHCGLMTTSEAKPHCGLIAS